jgi:glycosyltransferase involved in cell wall biosynthesis
MAAILFISYDGLTDPLGRSQVLPYLAGLSRLGHRVTLISADKPHRVATEGAAVRRLCEDAGIDWHIVDYRRNVPVLSGASIRRKLERKAVALHRANPFDIFHGRSHLPATVGLRLKREFGVKFLFDMRGFWPEEKVEAGSWPLSNPVFRAVFHHMKRIERRLLRAADHVVTLTEASLPLLRARPELGGTPVTVIPCCADFDHFPLVSAEARAASRADLGIDAEAHVLAYLGSIGAWYMLDEMLDFFVVYRRRHPDSVMLFVTPQDPDIFAAAAAARGLPADAIRVRAGTREQVPRLMAAADAGLFFIRPVSSKIASSPTKMAEMMALGLPIVGNAGVGDVAGILADSGCGVAIDRFDAAAYDEAIERLERVDRTPAQIRAAGLDRFDVAEGIRRYHLIYRGLLTGPEA